MTSSNSHNFQGSPGPIGSFHFGNLKKAAARMMIGEYVEF